MTRFSNCTIATRDYWHARIFATKRTIKISKELGGNKLSGYVSISILIKCGEWVVYAETVTYVHVIATASMHTEVASTSMCMYLV